MVNKVTLQSFISKYYLGGLNNQAKWKIKDKVLTVRAGTTQRACQVILEDFDFEDALLGIFDTHKLSKLISITNGELTFVSEKQHKIHTKLKIADLKYDLLFTLADVLIITKVPYYEDPGKWDVVLDLTPEIVLDLIKAKTALGEENKVLITSEENLDGDLICNIIFGDETGFSNKISYPIMGEITKDNIKTPFDSDVFKDVLAANKDMDKGTLRLNSDGMLKLNFESENIKSEYYIIRDE